MSQESNTPNASEFLNVYKARLELSSHLAMMSYAQKLVVAQTLINEAVRLSKEEDLKCYYYYDSVEMVFNLPAKFRDQNDLLSVYDAEGEIINEDDWGHYSEEHLQYAMVALTTFFNVNWYPGPSQNTRLLVLRDLNSDLKERVIGSWMLTIKER